MQYNKEGILRKVYSLIFVRDIVNDKILLGYKKRGFGLHKWNGLGGKVEPNESIVEGAKRETIEESGLEILSLKKVGYIEFQFESKLNEMLECHMFTTSDFRGEIRECEEILPKWFDTNKIPFEQMWKDDSYWFPRMLNNEKFKAYFLFKDDLETIISYKIEDAHEL